MKHAKDMNDVKNKIYKNNKNDILDAWILIEKLSEGDIKKSDKKQGDDKVANNSKIKEFDNKKFNKSKLKECENIKLSEELKEALNPEGKKINDNKKNNNKSIEDNNCNTNNNKNNNKQEKKRGFVIYFDIFPFKEVLEFIRAKNHEKETSAEEKYEEVKEAGDKISMAIYFDENFRFIPDKFFLSVSGYIRYKYIKEVKLFKKFQEHSKVEEHFKDNLKQRFEIRLDEKNISKKEDNFNEKNENSKEENFNEKNKNAKEDNYNKEEKCNEENNLNEEKRDARIEKFDKVFNELLKEYGVSVVNCRYEIVENLNNDSEFLHSFFIEDLKKAKEIINNTKRIQKGNLERYFDGFAEEKFNLDSCKESDKFNPDLLEEILQPKNYPLGRFPSNPEFALSFMQQVAVNLALNDSNEIRSVNGPPGTGKTTLLKDIFADLVVQQAREISKDKSNATSKPIVHWNNQEIKELSNEVKSKNIVVASSNNGAVQNIVNELPLWSGVDEGFKHQIENIDYFKDIANADISKEKLENGNYKKDIKYTDKNSYKKWGVFSMEGGKKITCQIFT